MSVSSILPCSFFFSFLLFLQGCGSNGRIEDLEEETVTTEESSPEEFGEQLNLTVLLDLSDRVEPTKHPASPEHADRDIEIVRYLTQLFKNNMEEKGAYRANDKMKVIFSPRPQDSEINSIASRLNVDLSKMANAQEKKQVFDSIEETFTQNLRSIYDETIETKNYPGSDIWRFFKNDVVDYAVERDPAYRNVLIILTDGYLYHKDSRAVEGSRSAYMTPQRLSAQGLRSSNWREKFEEGNYGYIATRDDLENLDILVLEINPTASHKSDEDVLKAYLAKWFEEMKVNKFNLYNSDLPEYTKGRIDEFLNGQGSD